MSTLCKRYNDEHGAALIVALGIVTLMIIIGVTVVAMSINSEKVVGHDRQVTVAQNIAEAGVDDVIAVTVANFDTVYPGGVFPSQQTPFYDGPQDLIDNNGDVVGTYEVWTQADPERPGNVLITSLGREGNGGNQLSSTVQVSVTFSKSIFDYVLFGGTPTSSSTATFSTAGAGDDEDDCDGDDQDDGCANIIVTGKVQVNGNIVTDSINGERGRDEDHHDRGRWGTVTFDPRAGFSDPVNYTGTFTGSRPNGTQPTRGATVAFPEVDFSSFTGSSVTTVNFPTSGVPAGGWTRSGSTFSISADDFQNAYGSFQVVKLTSTPNNVTVRISGDCSTGFITPTIMMEGVPGTTTKISELVLAGPDVNLHPANGLAIVAGEGKVTMQTEVTIGALGSGALVYLSGQNGTSSLDVSGNLIMYGSVVVNGAIDFVAVGRDEGEDDEHHHGETCRDDGDDDHDGDGDHDERDEHHEHESHITNMSVTYDDAFMNNPNLPEGWWTWAGDTVTAEKVNYART